MAERAKILVVDDEEDIIELVELNLAREDYRILPCTTGEKALEIAGSEHPDLIILDLMLPGIDGLEVCKRLKGDSKTGSIPVIMLTAKGEETDIVIGLELGADDYITKPFSGKVLVARVRRLLQKATQPKDEQDIIRVHDLTIDSARHEVRVKNKVVDLTRTEFDILKTLARRPGLVLSRYQIINAIHDDNYLVTDRAVDVQIVSLRKKLERHAAYVETIRGVGYRLKD
jgi:two-component system, OmpR family, alkaline phosphatase synthesis response regulator PhoP